MVAGAWSRHHTISIGWLVVRRELTGSIWVAGSGRRWTAVVFSTPGRKAIDSAIDGPQYLKAVLRDSFSMPRCATASEPWEAMSRRIQPSTRCHCLQGAASCERIHQHAR